MRDAFMSGVRAAKLTYLKQGGIVDNAASLAKNVAFGQAPRAFIEGSKAIGPGGVLHWKNVLWPTIPGHPVHQIMGRAGTLMMGTALPSLMRQDQGEGRLSKLLGGVGSLAGMAYGGTAGGIIGSGIGMPVGKAIGHGIGHLLGSRPSEPQYGYQ